MHVIILLVSAKPFSLFIKIKGRFPCLDSDLFFVILLSPKNYITMSKSTHSIGQPMFGQLLSLLDKN